MVLPWSIQDAAWSIEDPVRGVLHRLVASLGVSVDDFLSEGIDLDATLAEVQWHLAWKACRVAKGCRKTAARLLGIKPRRLVAIIRRGMPLGRQD